MNRRNFFGRSAALAVAFQADSLLRAERATDAVTGRVAHTAARDEDLWFNVRHAFITPNFYRTLEEIDTFWT